MKPIDQEEFWEERLHTAERSRIHYAVYLARTELWNEIERTHEEIIKGWIPSTAKVLDAGCGYGRLSVLFPNYAGVDFTNAFIHKARELYPQKNFFRADLKNLPFGDQQFDWAVCVSIKAMVINNLGEDAWIPMLYEIKRVAKDVLILEYEVPYVYEIL